jgi:hypothetical protein
VLEIQKAKEMSGTITLPPNPDLFLLSLCFVLASDKTARITPVAETPLVTAFKKTLSGQLDIKHDGTTCIVRPESDNISNSIQLSYEDLPFRDFIVFLFLGLKKKITFNTLSQKRLEVWRQKATMFGCTINTEESEGLTTLFLSPEEEFSIPDEMIDANSVHNCIGLALGFKKQISITIDHQFQSPLRHLLNSFGYALSIKSNVDRKESDLLSRRLRFIKKSKKDPDNKMSFTVHIDCTSANHDDITIELPGDDILAAIILAGKSLVQKGHLIVGNVSLESWSTATLNYIRKMQCVIGIQEGNRTSFGSTGMVSLQKFKLVGRKMDCRPLYHYQRQLPAMLVLSNYTKGQSVFRGLADLRNEIPDSIDQILTCISRLGGRHGEMPDGIVIDGAKHYDGFDLLETFAAGLAGACAIAGLKCNGKTTIEETSIMRRWPDFSKILESICTY